MLSTAILVIAGLDPTGGAGIAADVRVCGARGFSSSVVVTAIANQTHDVGLTVRPLDAAVVSESLEAALSVGPAAIKIGMLANAGVVRVVADRLTALDGCPPIVVDPVMASSSGMELLDEDGLAAMVERLFPISTLVTPNWDEAAALSGIEVDSVRSAFEAGDIIRKLAPAVLVTGGHSDGDPVDVLVDRSGRIELPSPRVDGDFRGTGCALSSLIAMELAKGKGLREAVLSAKGVLAASLARSKPPYIVFEKC